MKTGKLPLGVSKRDISGHLSGKCFALRGALCYNGGCDISLSGLEMRQMTHEEISLQTKKQFAEALKKAMLKKPFQKITVSELVKACGTNRKTFYYHFEDIYALLKWMFEQEAIDVVKSFDLIVDYDEAVNFIMDYIEENEHIISCAYDSLGRDALKDFFYTDFEKIMDALIASAEEIHGVKLEDGYREYLCRFYTEGLSGIMVNWIQNRDRRDRDKVIEYLVASVKDSLIGIMQKEREKGK